MLAWLAGRILIERKDQNALHSEIAAVRFVIELDWQPEYMLCSLNEFDNDDNTSFLDRSGWNLKAESIEKQPEMKLKKFLKLIRSEHFYFKLECCVLVRLRQQQQSAV